MELSKLPRAASSAKASELAHEQHKNSFTNLFKVRRTKGWWSLKSFDPQTQKDVYGGSLELEFDLVTGEEAEKFPVGLGRDDPHGLPKPK